LARKDLHQKIPAILLNLKAKCEGWASAEASSCLEVYRNTYLHLRTATNFTKVIIVFCGGHVGMLAG